MKNFYYLHRLVLLFLDEKRNQIKHASLFPNFLTDLSSNRGERGMSFDVSSTPTRDFPIQKAISQDQRRRNVVVGRASPRTWRDFPSRELRWFPSLLPFGDNHRSLTETKLVIWRIAFWREEKKKRKKNGRRRVADDKSSCRCETICGVIPLGEVFLLSVFFSPLLYAGPQSPYTHTLCLDK